MSRKKVGSQHNTEWAELRSSVRLCNKTEQCSRAQVIRMDPKCLQNNFGKYV